MTFPFDFGILKSYETTRTSSNNLSPMQKQVGGAHYKDCAIQPFDFIMANKLSFAVGNTIKYLCRYKKKNGIEDLKKARHYIDMLIHYEDSINPSFPESYLKGEEVLGI